MKKYSFKQISFNELWLSIVSTAVSSVLFNLMFKTWEKSLIAGLVIGLYAFMYSLYNSFSKEAEEANEKSQQALRISRELSERCVQLLKISNAFLYDEWLYCSINKVHDIHSTVKKNKTHLQFVTGAIDAGISDAEVFMNGKKIDYSGWKEEGKRQRKLRTIVENSNYYVKAVTSYDPVYWENFWNKKDGFSESYRKTNIEAAKRGVFIERIFILPNSIINGEDKDGGRRIEKIVEPMINKSENLNIYFVSDDNLSPDLSHYKKYNFLICDNLFVGLARDFANQQETQGYISIAIKSDVDEMLEIFNGLLEEAIDPMSSGLLRNKS